MPSARAKPKSIDDYLAVLSDDMRAALEKLRKNIRAAAPMAEERISNHIPAFRLNGRLLVAFGVAANHCAFYPGAFPVAAHKEDLDDYDTSKGTIRFHPSKPLPSALVRKLVKARIGENRSLTEGKAPRSKTKPQGSLSSAGFQTRVTSTLSVRNWDRAMNYYQAAFGARELYRVPGGGVGQLSISGAEFWVAEESKPHLNFSPETLGGCSVRMLLIVKDPAAACARAIRAGATEVVPVADAHGWRIGRIVDPFGHHWEIAKPLS